MARTARIERATKESKVLVDVDLDGTGRADISTGVGFYDHMLGSLARHVFESLSAHAGLALHVRVLSGRDPHHIVEAQFKAVARALREAVALDPREGGVPSTKGSL